MKLYKYSLFELKNITVHYETLSVKTPIKCLAKCTLTSAKFTFAIKKMK